MDPHAVLTSFFHMNERGIKYHQRHLKHAHEHEHDHEMRYDIQHCTAEQDNVGM